MTFQGQVSRIPPLAVTTRITARALGFSAEELQAALQPAGRSDLAELVAFRRRHLNGLIHWDDASYLQWRYRLGAQRQGFGELWALRRRGELLGIVGCEDMVCVDGTQRLRGQRLMDILIPPEVADSGLATWLNQTLFERADFSLAVGVNRRSKGLVSRLFAPLPPMQGLVHPLMLMPLLERSSGPRAAKRLLAGAGDAWMAGWDALLALRRSQGLLLRPIDSFGEGAQAWPRCDLHPRGDVQIERSSDYLNRRLLANPRVRIAVMGVFRDRRRAGYIAWHVRRRERQGFELRILDWHVSDERPLVCWSLLLRAAIAAGRQQGCVSVRLEAQRPDALPLRLSHGFIRPPRLTEVHVGLQSAAAQSALAARPWALNPLCDDSDDH